MESVLLFVESELFDYGVEIAACRVRVAAYGVRVTAYRVRVTFLLVMSMLRCYQIGICRSDSIISD